MKAKRFIIALTALMTVMTASAKTLVVYYSYTNNVQRIVSDLCQQIDADVVRVEPAEKGLKYEANGYAIGSAQISAIRNNPKDAASYPAIDPVDVDMDDYDMVIVAAPLWWSQMAAPLQAFLFRYGPQMSGKRIGLIVSSASSGLSGVLADARRLIPEGQFLTPNLLIHSSQTSSCHSLVSQWLDDIHYQELVSSVPSVRTADVPQVRIGSTGIRVSGSFDSLSLFNAKGQKVLETVSAHTDHPFASGSYVALLRKGPQTSTVKLVVK